MTIFDPASLHAAVVQALRSSDIPPDASHAFAVVVTPAGAKAVYTTRLNNVWSIDTVFSVDNQKHVEGGVSIKATW